MSATIKDLTFRIRANEQFTEKYLTDDSTDDLPSLSGLGNSDSTLRNYFFVLLGGPIFGRTPTKLVSAPALALTLAF